MMTEEQRYLTKSRFQTALECPTKLFYVRKSDEYPSTKDDDEFLAALAEGGFQVGALAKCYYPGGIDITAPYYEEPLRQTNELLKQENVTIFEAAVLYENLFIRIDVLEKMGRTLNLIEVKAKSINPQEDNFLAKKGGFIDSNWVPYLNDVAFQTWVVEKAFPEYTVNPFLMLADKSKTATVDGLNQHFFLKTEDGRSSVIIRGDVSLKSLGRPLLVKMPVRQLVNKIWQGEDRPADKKSVEELKPFIDRIAEYSEYYKNDKKYPVVLGKKCKTCEFRADTTELADGTKSGYHECWREKLGWDDTQFAKPHIFDIWDYRDAEERIAEGIYLMEDLNLEDEFMKPDGVGGLDYKKGRAERKHMQITKALDPSDQTEVIDPGLFAEMAQWKYPLHFIDFETSMVAVPFTKDRRPYEQLAFQFSCHTVNADGSWRHEEWIAREPGNFPNYDFLRALKAVLEQDEGTIFRYAPHENTVLRQIHDQIIAGRDDGRGELPADHGELITFIDTITTWKDEDNIKHPGPRNMVDMHRMVVKYYYHPAMGGSNSIKFVLPAVLQASPFLKEKYSKPYNGTNHKDMVWWQVDEEKSIPKDPYTLLPPLNEEGDLPDEDLVLESGRIAEGGAAMTAYARMQFTEMSDAERQAVIQGLLKYCELDTLAMVMIWEHWKSKA